MVEYLTQEGLDKVRAELRELKTKGRAEAASAIAEARDKGDLSENAEYDAAKDAQGYLEKRIAGLESTLASAKVIDSSQIDTSEVRMLSTVEILNTATKKKLKYTLVSETEASVQEGKISIKSPIGQGLLGKKPGEVAEVKTPNGNVIKLQVVSITA